jgi:hypothetical protein
MKDLFSESVSVIPRVRQHQLSRAQKTFNNLVAKIEKRRHLLAAWEAAMPQFQGRYAADMQPLLEQLALLRAELARGLDQAHGQKRLTKTERRKIAAIVSGLAAELAAEGGDEEMKTLYNKYSGGDYDLEEADLHADMKAMVEDALGFDVGDDLDLRSPDAFLRGLQARLAEEAEKQADAPRARRRKSAKQLAREEQLREEEQRVSQSLREIYRKLASALHPDREPNAQERARKTDLMQQVNQAYNRKNLLGLLELQLRIEHIDQAAIDGFDDERLAHFNKILKGQLGELELQIAAEEHGFRLRYNIDPYARLDPTKLLPMFDADIVGARQALHRLEADLRAIQDIATLKAWLRQTGEGYWEV